MLEVKLMEKYNQRRVATEEKTLRILFLLRLGSPAQRLAPLKKLQVIEYFKNGMKNKDLSEKYKVHHSAISKNHSQQRQNTTTQGNYGKIRPNEDDANAFREGLKAFFENHGYKLDNIYNGDETSLFWKHFPTKTFVCRNKTEAPGRKA
ncbi:hypothetical protein NQ318_012371 [Aromia moschata]|uniref:Transposase n=1 Tax=Aromia moschata TaxID=1265417 RepID=A0AAV8Y4N7_9CUCU|nr:hypothetical protein NQ318_012371 [Aromia moschata]